MLFDKIKHSIIRSRVKTACENLNIAKDLKHIGDVSMDVTASMYKQVFTAIPIIEKAIKRHPDEIADIAIEADKIFDSIERVVKIARGLAESEKNLSGKIEKSVSPDESLYKTLNHTVEIRIKRITANFKLIKEIVTGKKIKKAA